MSRYALSIRILFACCFLLVTVQGGDLRFKRQDDIDNTIIELFNNCKCVNYYQCDANNKIITNGETLLDLRMGEKTDTASITRIPCKGTELVCCKLNGTGSEDLRNPVIINTDYNYTDPIIHKCGLQRTKINVRIIVDDENNDDIVPLDGEFPWIAAIYKKDKNGEWKFFCSGSMIHPKVILTANHYFHRKTASDFKIILTGNVELNTIGKNANYERNVAEIVNHPRYYAGALYNDAALLLLDKPLEFSKTNSINTICLPPDNLVMNSGRCMVAGWGKGSTIDGVQVLKKVDLPLISHSKCQEQLRKTRLGTAFILHDSFTCAGGEKNKDACKGDGGSPLMCLLPGETSYFQMGIVSWGIGCGGENIPGVYGSVVKMKSWILEELNKREIHL